VFQTYYEEILLPDSSPSDIAWIGSVQYGLVYLPGLVMGRLFDLGYFKIPYFAASCVFVTCNFIIAECTEYWQFFLVQGLGVGICGGMLFGPMLGVVFHWFNKRKGLALGVVAMSASVGATVFPIVAQNLIPQVGYVPSASVFMRGRAMKGVIVFSAPVSVCTIFDFRTPRFSRKRNVPFCKEPIIEQSRKREQQTTLTEVIAKQPTYNPSASRGAIDNSDKIEYEITRNAGVDGVDGHVSSTMNPNIRIVHLKTFVWPFVRNEGLLIAIAVIYGFSCGVYMSIQLAPVRAMGGIGDIGRRTGMFMTLTAFGISAGPPISGAINSATGGFEDVGWYAGGIVLFSVTLLIWTRYLHLGKFSGRF
ncbi:hypothetical protein PAXINDRAFT_75029, partial [Paxillus involutus ATCC 200175]